MSSNFTSVKYWFSQKLKTTKLTDQHKMSHNSPESVANSVLKVHKVLVIKPKQISGVEEQVAFFQHITKPLLLSLLLVASVPDKGRPLSNLSHQKSRLTWQKDTWNMSITVSHKPKVMPSSVWFNLTNNKAAHFNIWGAGTLALGVFLLNKRQWTMNCLT